MVTSGARNFRWSATEPRNSHTVTSTFTQYARQAHFPCPGRCCAISCSIVPMFGHYPNGLTHFTRECFPEGFTIDRTVKFEGDGTMISHHTYELDGSNITTRVNLTMDGFDPEGAVMKNELVDICTTESHIFPWDNNSVRQICTIGFPKANDAGILLAHFNSKMTFCGSRKIKLPNPHFVTTTNRQMKDDSDKRDHIVQREIAIARPSPKIVSAI